MTTPFPPHDYGEYRTARQVVIAETIGVDHHPGNDAFWGACWAAADTIDRSLDVDDGTEDDL